MDDAAGNLALLGVIAIFLIYKGGMSLFARPTIRTRPLPRTRPVIREARRNERPVIRHDYQPIKGEPYVVDGDTIRIGRRRIRLFGMDAPEMQQDGGAASRAHLIRLIRGREVVAQPVDIDKYGRQVARVWLGGTDISARMVIDGYAVAMQDWHLDYVYHEKAARRDRRGLWAEDEVNGITCPAAFRRAQKAGG